MGFIYTKLVIYLIVARVHVHILILIIKITGG